MSNENQTANDFGKAADGSSFDYTNGQKIDTNKVNQPEVPNNADDNIGGHNKFTWLGENVYSSCLFSQSSEYINGLAKAFDKTMTEKFDISAKGINLKLVKVDSNVDPDLNGEYICFVMYSEKDKDKIVGIHPLFIADSKFKLQESNIAYNNSTYVMQHVHSELITESNMGIVKKYIAKCVPFTDPTIAYAQAGVVFIDKINTNDELQITNLIANSAAACHDAIRKEIAKKEKQVIDINLKNDSRKEDLESTRTINTNVLLDSLGCPVNRTGFEVQFSAKRKQQNNNGNNFITNQNIASKPIALVHGYVDVKPFVDTSTTGFSTTGNTFFSTINSPIVNQQALGYGNVQRKNYFVANITLTNLSQLRNQSLGNQLMTLAVAVDNVINDIPGQGLFWADMLNPMNQTKDDMHSIAGLTYEISTRENNLDEFKPMNVHSSKFDDEVYRVFMNQYFSPNSSVSLLVPRNGIDSWKYRTFVKAAYGNEDAINLLLDTANVLTDGTFAEKYKSLNGSNTPVYLGNNTTYHGTYYNQQLKQRRSLQDISFSYLLNIVDKKAQFFNDFVLPYVKATCADQLINNKDIDVAIRLALQKYVIENVASDVEILGISNEIVFEANFIRALVAGIQDVLKRTGSCIINRSVVNKAIINPGNMSQYLRVGMVGGLETILGYDPAIINSNAMFTNSYY